MEKPGRGLSHNSCGDPVLIGVSTLGRSDCSAEARASGAEHELDGIGSGSGSGVWIEAKARKVLMKHDVASFKIKCEDLYIAEARADARGTTSETWWPLLVSSEIVPTPVRRLCCATGIVLCEPRHLPLPVLLRAAGRPIADDYLRDDLMGELVRLGEPACQPMQGWWRIDPGERKIWRSLDGLDAEDISDLLYLQGELSDDLLDALERDAPELLDRRAAALLDRLSGRVLSM